MEGICVLERNSTREEELSTLFSYQYEGKWKEGEEQGEEGEEGREGGR